MPFGHVKVCPLNRDRSSLQVRILRSPRLQLEVIGAGRHNGDSWEDDSCVRSQAAFQFPFLPRTGRCPAPPHSATHKINHTIINRTDSSSRSSHTKRHLLLQRYIPPWIRYLLRLLQVELTASIVTAFPSLSLRSARTLLTPQAPSLHPILDLGHTWQRTITNSGTKN